MSPRIPGSSFTFLIALCLGFGALIAIGVVSVAVGSIELTAYYNINKANFATISILAALTALLGYLLIWKVAGIKPPPPILSTASTVILIIALAVGYFAIWQPAVVGYFFLAPFFCGALTAAFYLIGLDKKQRKPTIQNVNTVQPTQKHYWVSAFLMDLMTAGPDDNIRIQTAKEIQRQMLAQEIDQPQSRTVAVPKKVLALLALALKDEDFLNVADAVRAAAKEDGHTWTVNG